MALTEKHRNEIYQHLAPAWGDDVTQAFLSQFPAREGEEPITRDFLRAELAELRTAISDQRGDLQAEMAGLRTEISDQRGDLQAEMAGLRTEISDQRGDLQAEMAGLRTEISDQRGDLRAEMADLRADINRVGSRLAGLLVGVAGVLTAVIALT